MRFGSITVANLRCLERLEYAPAPGANLITGPNGSGKTSLLEAFAMASTGKSFLTNKWSDVVRFGSPGLSIRADSYSDNGIRSTIFVRKLKNDTQISIDGAPISTASQLARDVPVLVFNSKAPDLLTENPSNRRALIDRTLFHVEPDYLDTWKAYRQVLRQRNELVRAGTGRQVGFWNEKFAALAEIIDSKRSRLIDAINIGLSTCLLSRTLGPMKFQYTSGWSARASLITQLEASWSRDVQMGCTGIGAHRADFALLCDDRAISKHLSRGQSKIVVCSLLSALARFIEQHAATRAVVLVDDLAAELDDTMRHHAVDMISNLGGQSIYTAIHSDDIPEILKGTEHVFHVKHLAARATA